MTNWNKASTLVQSIVKPSITHSQAFNYIDIYLKQNDDFTIIINQVDYINSINEIKVNNILEKKKKKSHHWEEP